MTVEKIIKELKKIQKHCKEHNEWVHCDWGCKYNVNEECLVQKIIYSLLYPPRDWDMETIKERLGETE